MIKEKQKEKVAVATLHLTEDGRDDVTDVMGVFFSLKINGLSISIAIFVWIIHYNVQLFLFVI